MGKTTRRRGKEENNISQEIGRLRRLQLFRILPRCILEHNARAYAQIPSER